MKEKGKKGLVNTLLSLMMAIAVFVYAALVYYLLSPALNVQSIEFWIYIISIPAFAALLQGRRVEVRRVGKRGKIRRKYVFTGFQRVMIGIIIVLLGLMAIFLLTGQPIFAWKQYAQVAGERIENRDFFEDVPETETVTNIALMDTASAEIIGNRQMGSLGNLVSQFEPSQYSTITMDGKPVKVSALNYVSFFRYLRNMDDGIPGYIRIDPVSQKAEYVELEKGMRYAPGAYFQYDLVRHIHMRWPELIVEEAHFELDDAGNPYYICPWYEPRIGVFSARDVAGAVVVDPVSGAMERYELTEIPEWVDYVYDGELLCQQYDWNGLYKNGFWNFSRVGCVETTDGYGYKSLDNDIWAFTGVTSVASDESNIGFVLMNCRTGAIRYYGIGGAEEYSAMAAAEGEVQNLRYTAAFPSVVNIDGSPVYIMVLKDDSGLVKMHALVNVQDYTIVATGVTQQDAVKAYRGKTGGAPVEYTDALVITVEDVRYAQIDGNTYAYLISGGCGYRLSVAEDERCMLISAGDTVALLAEPADGEIIRASMQ